MFIRGLYGSLELVAGPSRCIASRSVQTCSPVPNSRNGHASGTSRRVGVPHGDNRQRRSLNTGRARHRLQLIRSDGGYNGALRVQLQVRFQSSIPKRSISAEKDGRPEGLSEEESRAFERLRPIIDSLPGPVDWAVAYGSGVRHQANADPTGPPPMTDFLLSTSSLESFHTSNLRQNPSHYPLFVRLLGGRRIAWLTDNWGAGVWYVTMVKIRDLAALLNVQEVKYGVISTERLRRDLTEWETLYVAGRLHKPVLPLITSPHLTSPLQTNLHSALSLSLLLLPSAFSEQSLWEQIAGISYAGDPRMSVPGAENPEKVKNIVRGKGAVEGLRGMYGGMLEGMGVNRRGLEDEGIEGKRGDGQRIWRGSSEEIFSQPDSSDHRVKLFRSLPAGLQSRIMAQFPASSRSNISHPPKTPRPLTDKTSSAASISSSELARNSSERDLHLQSILSGQLLPIRSPSSSSASGDSADAWRKIVLNEVSKIIRRPAFTQSFKGLFTAGFRKSFEYSLAKFRKWLKGRRDKGKGKSA